MSNNNNETVIDLTFPEIDWEKLEKGVLPKGLTQKALQEVIPNLFRGVRLLRENEEKIAELGEKYPELREVIQELFATEIISVAKDGNADFSNFRFLLGEAEKRGLLMEWITMEGKRAPSEVWEKYRVSLYNPRDQNVWNFLPVGWRNPTHQQVALALRELNTRAREAYRAEYPKEEIISPKSVEPEPIIPEVTPSVTKKKSLGKKSQSNQDPGPKRRKEPKGKGNHHQQEEAAVAASIEETANL